MLKLGVSTKRFDRELDKVGQYELCCKCWDEVFDIGMVICSRLTFRRFRKFKVGNSHECFTLLENRESLKKQNAVFCITVCVTFYYAFYNVTVDQQWGFRCVTLVHIENNFVCLGCDVYFKNCMVLRWFNKA
jgi:hypothetical protein